MFSLIVLQIGGGCTTTFTGREALVKGVGFATSIYSIDRFILQNRSLCLIHPFCQAVKHSNKMLIKMQLTLKMKSMSQQQKQQKKQRDHVDFWWGFGTDFVAVVVKSVPVQNEAHPHNYTHDLRSAVTSFTFAAIAWFYIPPWFISLFICHLFTCYL